jgi:hypothetical protein
MKNDSEHNKSGHYFNFIEKNLSFLMLHYKAITRVAINRTKNYFGDLFLRSSFASHL